MNLDLFQEELLLIECSKRTYVPIFFKKIHYIRWTVSYRQIRM